VLTSGVAASIDDVMPSIASLPALKAANDPMTPSATKLMTMNAIQKPSELRRRRTWLWRGPGVQAGAGPFGGSSPAVNVGCGAGAGAAVGAGCGRTELLQPMSARESSPFSRPNASR
jgi:hypothetical protein